RALPGSAASASPHLPCGPRPASVPSSWNQSPSTEGPGRTLQLQVLPQPTRLRTADWNLCRLLVFHPQDVVPTEPRDDLLDLVDVHHIRSMDPPETRRIHAPLH